jgi:malonate-semialdehyde dehydrogenase (acetylating)/methylmalonate-semialdehyde dehydrogenase
MLQNGMICLTLYLFRYFSPWIGVLNLNPQSTQTLLSRVPQTTSAEFDQAVEAASQAFQSWSRTSVIRRQRFAIECVTASANYHSFSQASSSLQHLLRVNADALANSIVLEQGKTFAGLQAILHM